MVKYRGKTKTRKSAKRKGNIAENSIRRNVSPRSDVVRSPATGTDKATGYESQKYALRDIKYSLAVGGLIFVILIVLYFTIR